ncbi:MAG: NAD(P)/FAD-dependent oxidoreductase [Oscillospiraceae bacterium]|nr:NAD(P)/FAD-dependent oxidoreductase [Oscillospiraceae bacterium]
MKVLIIGGGASGMIAALTASEQPDNEVVLLERQARMGRKLLATGNGRCNLTNRDLSAEHYHGQQPQFCRYALRAFGVKDTLAYFRSLGLLTVTEDSGRVYPRSDSANSVADVLRLPLEQRENVTIVTGAEVAALKRENGAFFATAGENVYRADRVIVCAGGCAGGKLGGTDLGYRLLSTFGHTRTKLRPSLVQLRTDTTYVRSLKGVRCEVEVRHAGQTRAGELQFTEYGVSGPVIFELSAHAVPEENLVIDFLPELTQEEITYLLTLRCRSMPKLKAEDLLTGMLHNRLGRTVLRSLGISLEQPCGALTDLNAVAERIKHFAIRVLGALGMDGAQVTAGGVRTEEFDDTTMESKLCRGLYAAGEVLDIDGDCGGYNLQWAWSSGRLAGQLRSAK